MIENQNEKPVTLATKAIDVARTRIDSFEVLNSIVYGAIGETEYEVWAKEFYSDLWRTAERKLSEAIRDGEDFSHNASLNAWSIGDDIRRALEAVLHLC